MERRLAFAALLLGAGLIAPTADAREFRVGQVEGLFDLRLSYGLLARVEERDPDIIGIANGGRAESVNFDDATLNYDKGIASNMVKVSTELTLGWRNLGAFVRVFGFYDFENALEDRERTNLGTDGRRKVGWDIQARDYYLTARFAPGGLPIQLRVGNQVLNWGESRLLRAGVDIVNPIDFIAAFQPAGARRDVFVPQGMIWLGASLTEVFSVEGFYQYDWEDVRLPPVGSFFSAFDAVGEGGIGTAVAGAGRFSDLGTDLDEAFDLPDGTLGFDPDFFRLRSGGRDRPSNQGQYGFTVQAILPALNSTKLALHFVNYHSRLPLVNAFTADEEAILETSQLAVDARADALAQIYAAQGDPDPVGKGQAAAETLTVGEYASETSFFISYPEDVRMLGASFNTATIRTGTLLSGEVSHHFDFPFQIWVNDVLSASLSPILFDPSFGETPLGGFGANEVVRGFLELDKTQVEFGLTQILGPRLWSEQAVISFDVGWVHVHDLPNRSRFRLNAPGLTGLERLGRFPTDDSWGYRLVGQLLYTGVVGGFTLRPRVVWTHDVSGSTPGPLGAFIEERKSFSVGVNVNYTNTYTLDLSYTNLFGAGRFNTLNDRDFVRLELAYHF